MTDKSEEYRKKEIKESTDPSMDEMGTVHVRTTAGWGPMDLRMTRREAMLNGYMQGNGPALPWKSDKKAEEERIATEQAQKAAKETEEKREQKIKESTEPSMEAMEGKSVQTTDKFKRVDIGGKSEKEKIRAVLQDESEGIDEPHLYTIYYEHSGQTEVTKREFEMYRAYASLGPFQVQSEIKPGIVSVNRVLTEREAKLIGIVGCSDYYCAPGPSCSYVRTVGVEISEMPLSPQEEKLAEEIKKEVDRIKTAPKRRKTAYYDYKGEKVKTDNEHAMLASINGNKHMFKLADKIAETRREQMKEDPIGYTLAQIKDALKSRSRGRE